ncbi:uncharacterized protein BP5553_10670 [Venustampulla echinocandica]|uniref:Uncharacterized protein n=1 Tax=Venustampulla echinocandica TaxID=2656787 RepID=A0A370T8Q9_9HELO|nr:uncharacterized protein BP5553_10670 [Venustampulla echinocandica]RDL29805.1 hypothetical protein BP5553_10670 [Venustampulla echinocandica]
MLVSTVRSNYDGHSSGPTSQQVVAIVESKDGQKWDVMTVQGRGLVTELSKIGSEVVFIQATFSQSDAERHASFSVTSYFTIHDFCGPERPGDEN